MAANLKSRQPVSKKEWDKQKVIERRLAAGLQTLSKQVIRIVNKYDEVAQITAAISALTDSPSWRKIALAEAIRMTKSIAVANARTWREAAARGQQSQQIYRALRAEIATNAKFVDLIRRNADYITSLPDDIAKHVTKRVSTLAIRGMRPEAMHAYLKRKAPELSEARINLIARTETAKTQAAITQIRAQQVGVKYYVWRTAEDQRVRSSHKHMAGVLCEYSSPPSPEKLKGEASVGYYGPGEIWNCRCYAEPVILPDQLPESVKVVQQGAIVRMSKTKFLRIADNA